MKWRCYAPSTSVSCQFRCRLLPSLDLTASDQLKQTLDYPVKEVNSSTMHCTMQRNKPGFLYDWSRVMVVFHTQCFSGGMHFNALETSHLPSGYPIWPFSDSGRIFEFFILTMAPSPIRHKFTWRSIWSGNTVSFYIKSAV